MPRTYDKAFFLGYATEADVQSDLAWLRRSGKRLAGARIEHRVIEHEAKEESPERCDHYLVILHEREAPPLDWDQIVAALGGKARAKKHGTAGPENIRVNFSRTVYREGFEVSLGGAIADTSDELTPIRKAAEPRPPVCCSFCDRIVGTSMSVLDSILKGGSGIHSITSLGNYCPRCRRVLCAGCALNQAKKAGAVGFLCPACGGEVEAYSPEGG